MSIMQILIIIAIILLVRKLCKKSASVSRRSRYRHVTGNRGLRLSPKPPMGNPPSEGAKRRNVEHWMRAGGATVALPQGGSFGLSRPIPPSCDLARNAPGAGLRGMGAQVDGMAWRVGIEGEECMASLLRALEGAGWKMIHSIKLDWPPGGDIDHLAIGPGGVWVINTKLHKYAAVEVDPLGKPFLCDVGVADSLERARREREYSRRVLSYYCKFKVDVVAALAYVGAPGVAGVHSFGDESPVFVAEGSALVDRLSGLPRKLLDAQVDTIYEAARDARHWCR